MKTEADISDVEKGSSNSSQKESPKSGFFSLFLTRECSKKPNSSPGEAESKEEADEHGEQWRKTEVLKVKENPPGWPRSAAVIESDANFLIFRKFGFLRTRLVVWHQDRLRELEERLKDLDDMDFETDENSQRALCDREGDDSREPASRRDLFERLSYELQKYDDLLRRYAELQQFGAPSERDRESVAGLIWNDGHLCLPDRSYIRHADDLIALCSNKETSKMHGLLLDLVAKVGRGRPLFRYLLRNKLQQKKLAGETELHLELFDKSRIDAFVAFLFTMVLVFLIMGPVTVLYKMRDSNGYQQLAIALASTTMFAGLVSIATSARRHEICGATAA
ncbi:hypothetical protein LTR93_004005 [Exophiala xenobiotica]|nr:hypothetical protein LTR93_004005 [Exophiala xenobiotica]